MTKKKRARGGGKDEASGSRKGKAGGGKDGTAATASLRFSGVNVALVVAGLLTIAAGYYLLAQGSITAAPILLVLGYVILLPLGLIL